ncbi:MAG TPA: hypothetical protein VLB80_00995 [Candidatus Babeliales bacterium]|nr:hypothetical protein [Candidatus Babeliales bacterium]
MQQVREQGAWEAWVEFFLQGITHSAQQACLTIDKINALFAYDIAMVNTLGRA